MYDKAKIYNLALSALLLQRQISSDPSTDKSNEAKVLNQWYDIAFHSTLQDLDLDSTMDQVTLSLIEKDPNDLWTRAYSYPSDCVYLRRLIDVNDIKRQDNEYTHHDKQVRRFKGQKAILTDLENAAAEYISSNLGLNELNAMAGLAIAYRLAMLSVPLIVGKGAANLRQKLQQDYIIFKTEAQEKDKWENFRYVHPAYESPWVYERISDY